MRVFPVDRLQGPRSRPTKVMVVLALLGGILFAVTAPVAASASPVSQCGYGSSSGNTRTCVSMGSKTVSTSATVVSAGLTLRSCLRRNGARVVCSAYGYVRPGSGTGNTWLAGGAVPEGTYCAVTWRRSANGPKRRSVRSASASGRPQSADSGHSSTRRLGSDALL